jgi:hypothetical protein
MRLAVRINPAKPKLSSSLISLVLADSARYAPCFPFRSPASHSIVLDQCDCWGRSAIVDTKAIMLPTAVHITGARRLPEKDTHLQVLAPDNARSLSQNIDQFSWGELSFVILVTDWTHQPGLCANARAKKFFDALGLVSLLGHLHRLNELHELPSTEPHV